MTAVGSLLLGRSGATERAVPGRSARIPMRDPLMPTTQVAPEASEKSPPTVKSPTASAAPASKLPPSWISSEPASERSRVVAAAVKPVPPGSP